MRTSRLPALVFVLVGAAASASEYFVSPQGNDASSGTASAPWKTLQKAADAVVAGDTVTVRDGTYFGFVCSGRSGTAAARIVFRSENRWGAKITSGPLDLVQLNGCSYVTLDGFELSGGDQNGIAVAGAQPTGADAREDLVQNCLIHDVPRHGVAGFYALNFTVQDNEIHHVGQSCIDIGNSADGPIIRRNHLHDSPGAILMVAEGGGGGIGGDGLISGWLIARNLMHDFTTAAVVGLDGAMSGSAHDNLIYNFSRAGIAVYGIDGAKASSNNTFTNNTVFSANASRAALSFDNGASDNVAFNNLLYSPTAGLQIVDAPGLIHDFNFLSSISGGVLSAQESLPPLPALVVDLAGNDFHLAAGSAALDTGTPMLGGAAISPSDLENRLRPQGMGVDRGAYEVGPLFYAPPDRTLKVGCDCTSATDWPSALAALAFLLRARLSRGPRRASPDSSLRTPPHPR